MYLINRSFQIIALAVFALPLNAYADSWSCSHGNNVREVHVVQTTSSPAPCEVVYKKLTEGFEDQTLWSATSDDSYCDEKAQGLVTKLESWGWVCTETVSGETEQTTDDAVDNNNSETETTTNSNTDVETGAATESAPE